MEFKVDDIFDSSDATVRNDINTMILQYLNDEKLSLTASTLRDEASLKVGVILEKRYVWC